MPEQQITLDDVKNFIRQITPNQDWLYIIQPGSIGDMLLTMMLSHGVQKRKNKSATVLIALERMKTLSTVCENIAGIVYLPDPMIRLVQHYCCTTGEYEGDNYIYGLLHLKTEKIGGGYEYNANLTYKANYDKDPTLSFIDNYKKKVFDIPLETSLMSPIISPISEENIVALNKQYILNKDHTIVFCPYALTYKNVGTRFWETLAQKFKATNYIVYTNVAGNEKPIDGTLPLAVNFAELNFIADKVKCFIGLRTGLMDFLALTKSKIFCLSPFPEWADELSINYPGCDNTTLYYVLEDYILPIKNYFQKDTVNAQINLSHPRINSSNIYFLYEDLLNRILDEVEKF